MKDDLTITPAEHGGYVVLSGRTEYGETLVRRALFAGQLDEALAFVRARYIEPKAQAGA